MTTGEEHTVQHHLMCIIRKKVGLTRMEKKAMMKNLRVRRKRKRKKKRKKEEKEGKIGTTATKQRS